MVEVQRDANPYELDKKEEAPKAEAAKEAPKVEEKKK